MENLENGRQVNIKDLAFAPVSKAKREIMGGRNGGAVSKEMRQSIRFALADSIPAPETNRLEIIDPEFLGVLDAFQQCAAFWRIPRAQRLR